MQFASPTHVSYLSLESLPPRSPCIAVQVYALAGVHCSPLALRVVVTLVLPGIDFCCVLSVTPFVPLGKRLLNAFVSNPKVPCNSHVVHQALPMGKLCVPPCPKPHAALSMLPHHSPHHNSHIWLPSCFPT